MDLSNRIILIGMPGSGKTTLGKELSEWMNLPFFDLDDLIESKEEKTIQQIFGQEGEDAFREMEASTLEGFCNSHNKFVLAAGGGTPCYYNNLELMNANAKTIYLDVSAEALFERMNKTAVEKRPLFKNENVLDKIKSLIESRRPFYEKAKHRLMSDSISVEDISGILKEESHRK
ncbi:shikimate kinase [Fulvivirga lutea]|uniref:Shikimate kinase n=1 Tax=Fulvivirga lutea TaxID=2810512 RepID=A0A974WGW3_9BACT|nr:shikimate kinase [Fulvivirga lutea]QSE97478.1 shikimate kinase [Fulvivirga lutea]